MRPFADIETVEVVWYPGLSRTFDPEVKCFALRLF